MNSSNQTGHKKTGFLLHLNRSLILTFWHNQWKNVPNNVLRTIKNKLIPWSSSHRKSRSEEVLIPRLRKGNIRLTYFYLLQGLHFPPVCNYCHTNHLTDLPLCLPVCATIPKPHPNRLSLYVHSKYFHSLL